MILVYMFFGISAMLLLAMLVMLLLQLTLTVYDDLKDRWQERKERLEKNK